MLPLFAILAAVASAAQSPEPAPSLSAQARAAMAPLYEAYEQVEILPPAKDDKERLLRLWDLDQGPRLVIAKFKDAIPEAEGVAAFRVINDEIRAHDRANQAALKAMIPPDGWFSRSQYGDKAVEAAFLVVQHALNDRPWMHEILTRWEPLVAKGEVPPDHYAHLYDRVALGDGKPQRYGTTYLCRDHRRIPDKLEDPERLDERRKALGLVPEDEYLKQKDEENGRCP